MYKISYIKRDMYEYGDDIIKSYTSLACREVVKRKIEQTSLLSCIFNMLNLIYQQVADE